MQTTIDYYNRNAQAYYERTVSADMSEAIERFARYVRSEGCIVDVGCGSGRDILYFRDGGFQIEGIDASEELCTLARVSTEVPITCATIQNWHPVRRYDGIWANASLLHLTLEEMREFIERLPDLLTDKGVAYMSFKSGIQTGTDADGRYFTNLSQETLLAMIHAVPNLTVRECWESRDALDRVAFTWVNVIVSR